MSDQQYHNALLRQQAFNNYYNQLGGLYGIGQANPSLYVRTSQQSGFYPSNGTQLQAASQREAVAAIPNEGIRAGELTAYRVWRITDGQGWLKSVATEKLWLPFETMEGDVSKGYGVFCCKHPAFVEDAYAGNYTTIVSGTVEIWGKIVEYEKGYRAQYGRIKSLDHIHCDHLGFIQRYRKRRLLRNLRDRYLKHEQVKQKVVA